MDLTSKGKLIISAAKSLKAFRIADPQITLYLHATLASGRLGLFASSIRAEEHANIRRIQLFAAEEGFDRNELTREILPWLERAGLCDVRRNSDEITEVTSLTLVYRDILDAVAKYYEAQNPVDEDRACLLVLEHANELPQPESVIQHAVASKYGEKVAINAIQLTKAYGIVASSDNGGESLLYAPRVWTKLQSRAPKVLSPLDKTDRDVLIYLINRVKSNQGYPESILIDEANRHGASHLLKIAIGIGLLNKTELYMAAGDKRTFLTTPHFYTDLADEFGEDMCDRVKIFLDSIRNGQYFGLRETGKIFDPESLLRALLNRRRIGPATAISTDYMVAERAGIIQVQREAASEMAYMEIKQEDTVSKVLEIVSSGTVEPSASQMDVNHMMDGTKFISIEQSRVEFGRLSGELAELEYEIIKGLREG